MNFFLSVLLFCLNFMFELFDLPITKLFTLPSTADADVFSPDCVLYGPVPAFNRLFIKFERCTFYSSTVASSSHIIYRHCMEFLKGPTNIPTLQCAQKTPTPKIISKQTIETHQQEAAWEFLMFLPRLITAISPEDEWCGPR